MKNILVIIFLSFSISMVHAENKTAEQLVSSKKKADIT